jgi:hypothetical protein
MRIGDCSGSRLSASSIGMPSIGEDAATRHDALCFTQTP